jgi:O-antigen/teichoic acid export membrane protein
MSRLGSAPLVRNSICAFGGYGTRLLIQAAYFIIIARCLGPAEYGAFIAMTAIISVMSPFVGLGSGNLLVKNVARDKGLFHVYWGNGLAMTLATGILLLFVIIALSRIVLPRTIPMIAIMFVGLSDLIFVRFLDLSAWAFQACESLSRNAQLNVLISLTRLVGIVALALTMSHPTVVAWSGVYFAGSVIASIMAVCWVTVSFGRPRLALGRIRGESVEGLYFSISFAAQTIYNDIDKVMVARLASLTAAGIYAAAYRLIDVAFIPIRAVLNAAYVSFFRHGAEGFHASFSYCRRLLIRILVYPVLVLGALMIGAPLVPHVLGRGFGDVTAALRWLALLPLLKALHYFVADSLTCAGYQGLRTVSQVGVAVFNTVINLWLIPAYGWRGAAWASLASDGLLAVTLWLVAIYLWRTIQRPGLRALRIGIEGVEQA